MARIISFNEDSENSYIALDPTQVENKFQTTLKIKTEKSDGLIYYIADNAQVRLLIM